MPLSAPLPPPEIDALAAREAAQAALAVILCDLAPAVFTDPTVPLATGIYREIRARLDGAASRDALKRFLYRWTHRPEYVRAIAAGTMRRDLDGHPTEAPTAYERESGAQWLADTACGHCAHPTVTPPHPAPPAPP
jgi:sRNA-binding protein